MVVQRWNKGRGRAEVVQRWWCRCRGAPPGAEVMQMQRLCRCRGAEIQRFRGAEC